MIVDFLEELAQILPLDIPNRDRVLNVTAQHLSAISAANEYMNLTRITTPVEAAVKHVFDSLAPWRHFQESPHVLDAGTGAGFPGIPLAAAFPQTRFTLAESVGKKARFVEGVVDALDLSNIEVKAERAESLAVTAKPFIITARAVAPLPKIVELFGRALKNGARLLLYKGPDVDTEIAQLPAKQCSARVLERYRLPHDMGSRTFVEVTAPAQPR